MSLLTMKWPILQLNDKGYKNNGVENQIDI